MEFLRIGLFLIIGFLLINSNLCDEHDNEEEHDHHDLEAEDDHYDEDGNERYESHHLDRDPHDVDPDYDEDVLTGTSHHEKRDKEETKRDIIEIFKNIDSNVDGKIQMEELLTHLTANMKKLHNESMNEEFRKVDTNGDKKVSLDEYLLFEHHNTSAELDKMITADNTTEGMNLKKKIKHEKDRFKAADLNSDGYLTENEYLAFMYPALYPHMANIVMRDFFDDLDINNDGLIDKKEYLDHFQLRDQKDKDSYEVSVKKANQEFAKYDKDNNGKIDPEEYLQVFKPGYDEPAKTEANYLMKETDSNKDGLLTLEEIEQHSQIWLGGPSLDDVDQDYDEHDHHLEDEL